MKRKSRIATITPERATQLGYRRISVAKGLCARIDRPDWKEHMARVGGGEQWVQSMGLGAAADQYRRVYSKDVIQFAQCEAKTIPTSCHDETGFVQTNLNP